MYSGFVCKIFSTQALKFSIWDLSYSGYMLTIYICLICLESTNCYVSFVWYLTFTEALLFIPFPINGRSETSKPVKDVALDPKSTGRKGSISTNRWLRHCRTERSIYMNLLPRMTEGRHHACLVPARVLPWICWSSPAAIECTAFFSVWAHCKQFWSENVTHAVPVHDVEYIFHPLSVSGETLYLFFHGYNFQTFVTRNTQMCSVKF